MNRQPLHRLVLEAEQELHLGTGRGSGFAGATHRYIPAATLRGAVCANWWRANPDADQRRFDALIAQVWFSDAVISRTPDELQPWVDSLDRQRCKHPRHDATGSCPEDGHDWDVEVCPVCGHRPEPAKGERRLGRDRDHAQAEVRTATRVALDHHEQAIDEKLYAREGLGLHDDARLVAYLAGDPGWLIEPGQGLRVGAARTVAGRVSIEVLEQMPRPELRLPAGPTMVRVELLTPGVYVDDFGFPTDRPQEEDLRCALGPAVSADVRVERAFTRWTTATGWHAMANRPKPADAAVIAHSCFHVSIQTEAPLTIPALIEDLGLRTSEGCGWARLSLLDSKPVPARPGATAGTPTEGDAGA